MLDSGRELARDALSGAQKMSGFTGLIASELPPTRLAFTHRAKAGLINPLTRIKGTDLFTG
jgi:hypothetical protein